jgi:hypothetical protein
MGHAGRQPAEDITDRDAHTSDTRLPTPLAGRDGNNVLVSIHIYSSVVWLCENMINSSTQNNGSFYA